MDVGGEIGGVVLALADLAHVGQGRDRFQHFVQGLAAHDVWNWFLHFIATTYPGAFEPAPPIENGVPNSALIFRLLVALSADGEWLSFSQTSRHHIPSASTSAHPGRGRSIEWATVSEARTEPEASTSTPFVLPVPISIPTNTSTSPPYVRGNNRMLAHSCVEARQPEMALTRMLRIDRIEHTPA